MEVVVRMSLTKTVSHAVRSRLRCVRSAVLAVVAVITVFSGAASAASIGARTSFRPTPAHPIVGKSIAIPTALYDASPPGSSSLITPTEAGLVARAMWQAWEQSLVASDTRALTQLEAPGQMLAGTINDCSYPVGTCVQETKPRPIYQLVTVVPLQRSYPLYFLAEVKTKQYTSGNDGLGAWTPWVELQILTKASPSSYWRLSFDSGYSGRGIGATVSLLPFDSTEVESSPGKVLFYNPSPYQNGPIPTSEYLGELTSYWQSFPVTGHAPSHTLITTDEGFAEQLSRQGSTYAGSRSYVHFSVEPSAGTWTFTLAGGYPMICGSIVDDSVNVPVTGALFQNASETNFGISLPPGYYRKITTTIEHQICVLTVAKGLQEAGNQTYDAVVTGVRAGHAAVPPSSTRSELQTDYWVLTSQLGIYARQLSACKQRHGANCEGSAANNAAGEFAGFASVLDALRWPNADLSLARSLAATSARLSRLFAQIHDAAQAARHAAVIRAQEDLLAAHYQELENRLG